MLNQNQQSKPNCISVYSCKPRPARSVPTDVGKPVIHKIDFYVEDGEQKSRVGDEIDLIAYLQSSQASTDIANIVARLESGDTTVINVKPQGLTGDITQLPHSVNDINSLTDKISKSFELLPDNIKSLFVTPADFVNAVLENKLKDILSDIKKSDETDEVSIENSEEISGKGENNG